MGHYYDYYAVMKYVSTAELKAKLSSYLAQVREGGSVYVTSHGRAVAELSPVREGPDLGIRKPERPVSDLKRIRPESRPPSPAEDWLLEDRGRR
jgi:prevent-host-death family protein